MKEKLGPDERKTSPVERKTCRDLLTNINRSDYSFALEKPDRHPPPLNPTYCQNQDINLPTTTDLS